MQLINGNSTSQQEVRILHVVLNETCEFCHFHTNDIDITVDESFRQVLAYHYLSIKRSDLNIKRVIVFDATSGKHVTVDIDPKNWKENCKYGYKE